MAENFSKKNESVSSWIVRLLGSCRAALRPVVPKQSSARRFFLLGVSATTLLFAAGCASAPPPTTAPSGPSSSGSSGQDTLPLFPWQPPRPTARLELKELNKPEYKTFGAIADAIVRAAYKAGFGDAMYYSVPGGFAVLVQPEVISSNLSPLSPRFLDDIYETQKPWLVKLVEFLGETYSGPKNSRQIAILVTDRTIRPTANLTETSYQEMERVFAGGDRALPYNVRNTPRPAGCKATALVYHFQIKSNGKVNQRFVAASKEPQLALKHLEKAKLSALV